MRRPPSLRSFIVTAALAAAATFATPGCAVTAPSSSDAAIAARLDSIAQAAAGQGFSGILVVHRGGKEVLSRGYGLANRATGARFTPQTVVPIGSNVKDFTKAAILALVEGGKLRLADSLGTFFPGAPGDKRGITVDQLLEHRAGLPLGVGQDEVPLTKDEILARVWARPLGSRPGTEERYSNAGFSLRAANVEAVNGEAFGYPVARNTSSPLRPADTGAAPPEVVPAPTPAVCAFGQRSITDPVFATLSLRGSLGMTHDWTAWT